MMSTKNKSKPGAFYLAVFLSGIVGSFPLIGHAFCPDPAIHLATEKSSLSGEANPEEGDAASAIAKIKALVPETTCLYASIVNDYIHESLETHTLNTETQMRDQERFYNLESLSSRLGIRLKRLIPYVIALHDIGKPLAQQLFGNADKQTVYTRPILLQTLRHFHFSEREIALADALVSHDLIGETVQKKLAPVQAASILRRKLDQAGVSDRAAFFQLQLLYYVSDATAHVWIRENHFLKAPEDGKLWPKDSAAIDALAAQFP